MTSVRLLPVVLIAVIGLFFVKITHLVANSDTFSGSTTQALAQETPGVQQAEPTAESETSAAVDNADVQQDTSAEEPTGFVDGMKVDPSRSSRSELALLERLALRRDELTEREKSLEMREALLKAAEKRLQQRVDELRSLEDSIKLASNKRNKEQEEDLGKLVSMYQTMKPKQAAKIFEVLEPNVLLEIVKIMNPRKMSAILGQMKASSASALSLAIAQGNSLEDDVESMGMDALPQIGN
ncbi:MotE family protein [Cohaesibacter celericrescens]|uniref:Magnesium transporter MgtE intracellular domain-containing protein n=1 Tax=Cohaesibacter celericrescens TaxID=2067669 RepID=A0A2N5XWP3_9HYPH|nr:hypothetical protein [Cohaesibacter celericrescens]PLW78838.1 hypothetical protein C0081_00930 [Cohaesibacter celericrescens]